MGIERGGMNEEVKRNRRGRGFEVSMVFCY